MLKKVLKIGGVVVGIVLLATIIFFFYMKLQIESGRLIRFGDKWYTHEEVAQMYPQIRYADVPTRVTPEETYANFRQALKDNNLEMAIAQLNESSKRRYDENVTDLRKAFEENRFKDIYSNYPENISEEMMSESIAQFYFNYKEKENQRTHFIDFVKNVDGDWKIDNF